MNTNNLEMFGKQVRNIFSNKIRKDELKPGDHIYSWRKAYVYAHHGIYIGDDKVIHFTRGAGQEIGTGVVILDRCLFSSSLAGNSNATPCGMCRDQTLESGVMVSCIDCFLCGGDHYLFEYEVSPAFFFAKARGGTCTLAASDPPEDVLHRANYLLQNGFGIYNIFNNNCEDFAIYCKTGLLVGACIGVGRSGQAAPLVTAAEAIVSLPLQFLYTSFAGLTVVAGGIYSISRLVSDIGVRRDVVKIAVESLVAHSGKEEEPRVCPVAHSGVEEPDEVAVGAHSGTKEPGGCLFAHSSVEEKPDEGGSSHKD